MAALVRIRDGLFKIADFCHVYAVRCPQGVLLVDAGEEKEFAAARANLAAAGLENPPWVLITHSHFDHTEAASRWRDFGARIAVSELEADSVESGQASRVPCPVDLRLRPDETLELLGVTVIAHAAPGHTPGSVAYEIPVGDERWLFTGDLVMADLCPGWLGQFRRDATIATLRKLARRPIDSIATGHSILPDEGTGLLVDSLVAAFDGTWERCLRDRRDELPGGDG